MVAVLLIAGSLMWSRESNRFGGPPHSAGTLASAPQAGGLSRLSRRPVFSYSVIPGGVYSVAELAEAISTDPPVASHYENVSLHLVRSEIVAADRWAYVSYRKGDRILWTKRKLLLRHGETILTDGVTEIRGRCGNGISLRAMAPTADVDPGLMEFDALTAEEPDPPLISSPLGAQMDPWIAGGASHAPRVEGPWPAGRTAFPIVPVGSVSFAPPFESPIPTPEPGTLLMVGSGIAMLARLRHRLKR